MGSSSGFVSGKNVELKWVIMVTMGVAVAKGEAVIVSPASNFNDAKEKWDELCQAGRMTHVHHMLNSQRQNYLTSLNGVPSTAQKCPSMVTRSYSNASLNTARMIIDIRLTILSMVILEMCYTKPVILRSISQ